MQHTQEIRNKAVFAVEKNLGVVPVRWEKLETYGWPRWYMQACVLPSRELWCGGLVLWGVLSVTTSASNCIPTIPLCPVLRGAASGPHTPR